jgi:hypothetical protein
MRVYLKIKLKSLAAESIIIRKEMAKFDGPSEAYQGLHLHRVNDVRDESRSALLAYTFLKGKKTYKEIEKSCYTPPNWKRVEKLVTTYGAKGDEKVAQLQRFIQWKNAD